MIFFLQYYTTFIVSFCVLSSVESFSKISVSSRRIISESSSSNINKLKQQQRQQQKVQSPPFSSTLSLFNDHDGVDKDRDVQDSSSLFAVSSRRESIRRFSSTIASAATFLSSIPTQSANAKEARTTITLDVETDYFIRVLNFFGGDMKRTLGALVRSPYTNVEIYSSDKNREDEILRALYDFEDPDNYVSQANWLKVSSVTSGEMLNDLLNKKRYTFTLFTSEGDGIPEKNINISNLQLGVTGVVLSYPLAYSYYQYMNYQAEIEQAKKRDLMKQKKAKAAKDKAAKAKAKDKNKAKVKKEEKPKKPTTKAKEIKVVDEDLIPVPPSPSKETVSIETSPSQQQQKQEPPTLQPEIMNTEEGEEEQRVAEAENKAYYDYISNAYDNAAAAKSSSSPVKDPLVTSSSLYDDDDDTKTKTTKKDEVMFFAQELEKVKEDEVIPQPVQPPTPAPVAKQEVEAVEGKTVVVSEEPKQTEQQPEQVPSSEAINNDTTSPFSPIGNVRSNGKASGFSSATGSYLDNL